MSQFPTNITKILHRYPKKHGLDIEWISNELWNRFGIKIAHSTLQRQLNPNDDMKLWAEIVGPLCIICNNDFSVCEHIKKDMKGIEIKNSSIALLIKKVGSTISEITTAMEDGVIDEDERKSCTKEIVECKALFSKFLATLTNRECL